MNCLTIDEAITQLNDIGYQLYDKFISKKYTLLVVSIDSENPFSYYYYFDTFADIYSVNTEISSLSCGGCNDAVALFQQDSTGSKNITPTTDWFTTIVPFPNTNF